MTNTGSRAGAEVIQVYVRASAPSINRPSKELKGFEKVFLQPDEEKIVTIEIDKKLSFSFWAEGREAWIMEKGHYWIIVGNSSVSGEFYKSLFEVEETSWWLQL